MIDAKRRILLKGSLAAGAVGVAVGAGLLKAPDIAENGAVVPVTVESDVEGISSISIFAAGNQMPLVASFNLGEGALGFVSTRIKMAKTADVIAVVKAGDRVMSAAKEVKVTIGGCG